MLLYLAIIKVLPTFMGNMSSVDAATPTNECQPSVNTASTECQHSVNDCHDCMFYIPGAMILHSPIIEVLPTFMCNLDRVDVSAPKMSVNRASTNLVLHHV
jgi:hypothetical protein